MNKPYIWETWRSHGINFINDVIDDNGQFLDHVMIQTKFNVPCNFLQALQLRQSVPFLWRQTLFQDCIYLERIDEPFIVITNNKIKPISKSKSKEFYWIFVSKKKIEPKCKKKWDDIFGTIQQWDEIFTRPFHITAETKIQSFQFKILHNVINCNKKLCDMKIKPVPTCSYCPEVDDIQHFFFSCGNVFQLWLLFFNWWNTKELDNGGSKTNFPIFPCGYDIIFGIQQSKDRSKLLNYCVLYTKFFIYRKRLFNNNELTLFDLLAYLKYQLQILKLVSLNRNGSEPSVMFIQLYDKVCETLNS